MAIENQRLSKTQKNQIFLLIVDHGLNPMDFAWRKFTYETDSVLGYIGADYECDSLYRNKEFYFKFCRSGGAFGYYPEFCPGGISRTTRKEKLNWPQVLDMVTEWLSLLKSEVDEPDFWDHAMSYITPLGIAKDPERKFTEEEIINVEAILQDLRQKLNSALDLNNEQNERLGSHISYLVDEARRQSVRNWIFLFIGLMATCILTLPIAPEKTPLFWQIVSAIKEPVKALLGIK